jgi:hypothetical protein
MKDNYIPVWFGVVCAIIFVPITITACNPVDTKSAEFLPANGSLQNTLSTLGTETSQLATQIAGQVQIDAAQQDAISCQASQLSSISESVTETPVPLHLLGDPTPYPVCTPPTCAPDEIYHCPDECPGGCGTTCATATPGVSSGYGHVLGKICYPGGFIPKMRLNFQEVNTQRILMFSILGDQDSYSLDIPAGVYVAFTTYPDNQIGGGYTYFVGCDGDTSPCTDHSLVPFVMQENHVRVDVNICDWHSDAIIFPVSPEK